jgi:hypothetical protein
MAESIPASLLAEWAAYFELKREDAEAAEAARRRAASNQKTISGLG